MPSCYQPNRNPFFARFKNLAAYILTIDLNNKESFNNLDYLLKMIKEAIKRRNEIMEEKEYLIFLIGVNCDDIESREVVYFDALSYCEERGIIYYEVCYIEGDSVDVAFDEIMDYCFEFFKGEFHEIKQNFGKREVTKNDENWRCSLV